METRSHVMDGSQMRKAMPKAHGAGPGITILSIRVIHDFHVAVLVLRLRPTQSKWLAGQPTVN